MKFKKLLCLMFCMLMLLAVPAVAAEDDSVTVLFTHDMHSHLLPANDENGQSYGGFARLMTEISRQRNKYPDAILVDAGDFSMGSLFQTEFATSAIELRMMGAMGYDATTFGNHEFDYLPAGLASMLNVAASCAEPVPAIVDAKYAETDGRKVIYSSLNPMDLLRNANTYTFVLLGLLLILILFTMLIVRALSGGSDARKISKELDHYE